LQAGSLHSNSAGISFSTLQNFLYEGETFMSTGMRLFIAGDSTAATKQADRKPETGWGEKIAVFFPNEVEVCNFAANGRSSKSFINEGRLQNILDTAGEGDCLFIQFGHNDEKDSAELNTDPYTTYQSNLSIYIDKARDQDMFPILLTPVQRRHFLEHGKLQNTHRNYPDAMRKLAKQLSVPLIDMTAISGEYFEKLGPDKSKELFLWANPGECPNYPNGVQDDTHFNENGAIQIARLIVEDIRRQKIHHIWEFIK
jgi:lysophospholipase L1-like esterase